MMRIFLNKAPSARRVRKAGPGTRVRMRGLWVPALRCAAAGMTAVGLAAASPALAGTPVTLKADAVDADGVVTLGDIFDGAGGAAGVPVAARAGGSVMLNAGLVQAAARRAGLEWINAQGLRHIVVRGAASGPAGAAAARGEVDVLVWARSIAAGEVVQPTDLVWGKAAAAASGAPTDPDLVVGLAARRPVRAGAAVTSRDVAPVEVVKPNDVITLAFEDGGIFLSLQARAMTGGAVGDTISVQNVTSKKIVQAVVAGPGQAAVGPAAEQLKLSRATRLALR